MILEKKMKGVYTFGPRFEFSKTDPEASKSTWQILDLQTGSFEILPTLRHCEAKGHALYNQVPVKVETIQVEVATASELQRVGKGVYTFGPRFRLEKVDPEANKCHWRVIDLHLAEEQIVPTLRDAEAVASQAQGVKPAPQQEAPTPAMVKLSKGVYQFGDQYRIEKEDPDANKCHWFVVNVQNGRKHEAVTRGEAETLALALYGMPRDAAVAAPEPAPVVALKAQPAPPSEPERTMTLESFNDYMNSLKASQGQKVSILRAFTHILDHGVSKDEAKTLLEGKFPGHIITDVAVRKVPGTSDLRIEGVATPVNKFWAAV